MATSMLRTCTELLLKCQVTATPTCQVLSMSASTQANRLAYGAKWRLSKGAAINGSSYGVLTDLPDYTFLDGRPTPLSARQKRRRVERMELAKRVVSLVKEMEFGKANHRNRKQQEQERREHILQNKLKPKAI
ncbi:hypothetical protein ScPMuIL_000991 [Solemya velum]